LRILVVANPVAGSGRARRRARELVAILRRRGHEVDWFLTRRAGDARRRAAERGPASDCIVTAGGDGTLAEVVNGLPEPGAVLLVPMALGTANMLVRELRIPRDPEALADLIEAGTPRRIDLGHIDATRFVSVVGIGFDAMVTQRLAGPRGRRLGYRGYALPILRTLAGYRPPRLSLRVDGNRPREGAFAIVSNIRNYGGIFRVASRARCDSGRLDVCLFRRAAIPDLVRCVPAALAGRLADHPGIEMLEGTRVEIDGPEPVAVQVDGDYWGCTPVSITVEPRRLPVLAPPAVPAGGPPRDGTR
jgi:diacylglycerol kinase (ATP)